MPKLYVGNPTRQTQRLFYRLDFAIPGQIITQSMKAAKFVDIKQGQQETVGGDLDAMSQVEELIQQITNYGACAADEIDRYKGTIDYLYSVDKAISSAQLDKAFRHNLKTLNREGEERRKRAAIAAATVIESPEAKISIEQETESELGEGLIAEGFHVDKTNDGPASRMKDGGRKR